MTLDWSIAEVARLAGTTSRTLRHYESVGLLEPSRVASNGYRYYDEVALRRLQRILLLRQLGLGLPAIAEVLSGQSDDAAALRTHLMWLANERARIDRLMASVTATIDGLEKGDQVMAEQMLDGFDNSQYQEEVEARWGKQAWADGQQWWSGLGKQGQAAFMAEHQAIAAAWAQAREAGLASDDPQVLAVAKRHVAWIAAGWQGRQPTPDQVAGLADMYVADERFAANYGGVAGAEYVRDGLLQYVLS